MRAKHLKRHQQKQVKSASSQPNSSVPVHISESSSPKRSLSDSALTNGSLSSPSSSDGFPTSVKDDLALQSKSKRIVKFNLGKNSILKFKKAESPAELAEKLRAKCKIMDAPANPIVHAYESGSESDRLQPKSILKPSSFEVSGTDDPETKSPSDADTSSTSSKKKKKKNKKRKQKTAGSNAEIKLETDSDASLATEDPRKHFRADKDVTDKTQTNPPQSKEDQTTNNDNVEVKYVPAVDDTTIMTFLADTLQLPDDEFKKSVAYFVKSHTQDNTTRATLTMKIIRQRNTVISVFGKDAIAKGLKLPDLMNWRRDSKMDLDESQAVSSPSVKSSVASISHSVTPKESESRSLTPNSDTNMSATQPETKAYPVQVSATEPCIKYDMYQQQDSLTIEFYKKKLTEEDVHVDLDHKSATIIFLAQGCECTFSFAGEIDTEAVHQHFGVKYSLTLQKVSPKSNWPIPGVEWRSLDDDEFEDDTEEDPVTADGEDSPMNDVDTLFESVSSPDISGYERLGHTRSASAPSHMSSFVKNATFDADLRRKLDINLNDTLKRELALRREQTMGRSASAPPLSPNTSPKRKKKGSPKGSPRRSPMQIQRPQPSNCPGACGLLNPGVDCFMNTIIQCLMTTTEFASYFLDGSYEQDINVENALSRSKGKLATGFAQVLKRLGANGKPFSLNPFKRLLHEFWDMYDPYTQQDAHEFLNFLLDEIHEDVNKIVKKPYIELPDYDTKTPDQEIATTYWDAHRKRNESIVVDLFQGQYRSQITCKSCQKTSVKFDAFMNLSMEIPEGPVVHEFFVMTCGPEKYRISLNVESDFTIGEVLKKLSHILDIDITDYSAIVMKDSKLRTLLRTEDTIKPYLSGNQYIFFYELKADHVFFYVHQHEFVPIQQNHRRMPSSGTTSTDEADDEGEVQGRYQPIGVPFLISISANHSRLRPDDFYKITALDLIRKRMLPADPRVLSDPLFEVELGRNRDCTEDDDGYLNFLPGSLNELNILWPNGDERSTLLQNEFAFEPVQSTESEQVEELPLADCIAQHLKEEEVDEWYCSQCKTHTKGVKKLDLWRLPRVLIIHLKRFVQHPYSNRWVKQDRCVEAPLNDLKVGDFSLCPDVKGATYDLFAVGNHYGGTDHGHYIAFCKRGDDWLRFDDDHVEKIEDISRMPVKCGYVFFYRRRDPENQLKDDEQVLSQV